MGFVLFLSRTFVSAQGCSGLAVEPAGTELCFQKALHHTSAVCLNTHSLCSNLTEMRGKILRCWNGIFTALKPHAELRWLSQLVVRLALISARARNAGERQQYTDVSFNLIHSNIGCKILPHSFRHLSRWMCVCAVSSDCYSAPCSSCFPWSQSNTIDTRFF